MYVEFFDHFTRMYGYHNKAKKLTFVIFIKTCQKKEHETNTKSIHENNKFISPFFLFAFTEKELIFSYFIEFGVFLHMNHLFFPK